jgi:hypothetical protein
MKTSLMLALLGKSLTLADAGMLTPLGASPHSSLILIGLAGLALLTLRSERWRTPQSAG